MNWTHDDELERRVLELRFEFRESALPIAVDRLLKLEREHEQLRAQLDTATRQLCALRTSAE